MFDRCENQSVGIYASGELRRIHETKLHVPDEIHNRRSHCKAYVVKLPMLYEYKKSKIVGCRRLVISNRNCIGIDPIVIFSTGIRMPKPYVISSNESLNTYRVSSVMY